jgi:hypothetical protein
LGCLEPSPLILACNTPNPSNTPQRDQFVRWERLTFSRQHHSILELNSSELWLAEQLPLFTSTSTTVPSTPQFILNLSPIAPHSHNKCHSAPANTKKKCGGLQKLIS